jgi:hypothetical protein
LDYVPSRPSDTSKWEFSHIPDPQSGGKGRLMLPIAVAEAASVPAERDGALVTVFLPRSTGRPRPGFAAAALPLDARGRLTVTAGMRREAGIPDGADVGAAHRGGRGPATERPRAARLVGHLHSARP